MLFIDRAYNIYLRSMRNAHAPSAHSARRKRTETRVCDSQSDKCVD